MNIRKHFKKFILVLVLLMIVDFCIPKNVHAWIEGEDIIAAPAKIFLMAEEGILKFLNNIFVKEDLRVTIDGDSEEDSFTLTPYVTPETIIKGKFILFDANIFKNLSEYGDDYYDYDASDTNGFVVGGKTSLREIISGWYYTLRNFAIIALLSVLVYVGIRMILSTIAQDKAKYKAMFKDWLVAICLLVFMHLFMIAILNISSEITKALGGGENSNMLSDLIQKSEYILSEGGEGDEDDTFLGDGKYVYRDPETDELLTVGDAYAFVLVIMGIIIYTFIFAIKYLKREFTIIFLILLGPVSCITYPIDKIGDGKAQAFNRWFSEFLYQVIIQPFHLLLYIVLIGTAANMASKNVIYSLVCFAVMGPAEKFIKEMFGFKDKLGSPLGTMMKAGFARDMVNRATSRLMGGKNGGSGSNGGSDGGDNNALPQRPATRNIDNALLGSPDGSNGQSSRLSGGTAGAQGQSSNPSTGNGTSANNLQEGQQDPRQAMLDAYDENFGTPDYDPTEREAMARELIGQDNGNQAPINREDLAQTLRDSGMSEEEIAETLDGLPQMAGDTAGIAAINEAEGIDTPINGETEGDRAQANQQIQRQLNEAFNRQQNQENANLYAGNWRSIHAQRMAKKYGTTSRGKRWARRLGKGAKNGVRSLAKGTLIAGAATIGASAALLTGNGAEAAAILGGTAALGIRSGTRKIKGLAKSASNATKDYYRNDAIPLISKKANDWGITDKNKRAFAEFESDPDQLNRAILSYRKKHDGDNPSYIDLQKEMRDRFALSQLKLNDSQIDNAIGTYQDLRDVEGIDDEVALNQAAFAAQLADRYSAKDFGSEKTMNEAVQTIASSRNISKADAIQHLQRAAKMKGTDMVKLPDQTRTIDINTQPAIPSWVGNLGISTENLTEANVEQITRLNVRIHETGFDEGQLRLIAGSIDRTGDTTRVITNLEHKIETSAEYINNPSLRNDVENYLQSSNEPVTRENIDSEMRERFVLSDTFNIRDRRDLNTMRDLEKRTPRTKSQKQAAREMAVATRGLSEVQKKAAEKKLTKQLTEGGSSAAQAATDAKNVMELAEMYNASQTPQ